MNNLPFPDDLARVTIKALVKRLYGMFAPYQGRWGREDLEQEALIKAHAAWPNYDPERSAPNTFIYIRARGRVYDILRSENRRERRDHIACELNPEVQPAPAAPVDDPFAWNPETPLEDWLTSIYAASRTFYNTPRDRRGRRYYNAAQMMAVGLLAVRLELGSRECRQMLLDRPELRDAIRLKHVPSHWWIWSVTRSARTFYQSQLSGLVTPKPPVKTTEVITGKIRPKDFFVPARKAG